MAFRCPICHTRIQKRFFIHKKALEIHEQISPLFPARLIKSIQRTDFVYRYPKTSWFLGKTEKAKL